MHANSLQDNMVLSLFSLHGLPADTLSQSHACHRFLDQSSQNPLFERSLLFHISFLVTVILSTEQAVYEAGKGVSAVCEVARGGECQQTSAPAILAVNHRIIVGETCRDPVQWLEVLAQLERKCRRSSPSCSKTLFQTPLLLAIW